MNRSEELCKLLGVKPRYCSKNYYEKSTDNPTYFPLSTGLKYKESSIGFEGDFDIEVFPNMYLPSNFVKLLKLKYGRGAYVFDECQYKMDVIYVENLEDEVISNLISKIQLEFNDKCKIFEDLELFKQQAQRVDWEY